MNDAILTVIFVYIFFVQGRGIYNMSHGIGKKEWDDFSGGWEPMWHLSFSIFSTSVHEVIFFPFWKIVNNLLSRGHVKTLGVMIFFTKYFLWWVGCLFSVGWFKDLSSFFFWQRVYMRCVCFYFLNVGWSI